MKTIRQITLFLFAMLFAFFLTACSSDDDGDNPEPVTPVTPDDDKKDAPTNNASTVITTAEFAKGADVSWVTEMESSGKKFYDANGNETECMTLLQSLGTNAIRLRVWVNPTDGWCGLNDVLAKAKRASTLGLRLMIDFHYSDTWADPSEQPIPSAWAGYTLEQLKSAVASHTTEVLQTLKSNGIDVEWVQVGNETNQGMLWGTSYPPANASNTGYATGSDFTNFVQLINSGYDAVKAVYPDAKVIIHTSDGNDLSLFTWMYGNLKTNNAKYDVIGMSLYPDNTIWETTTNTCLTNIKTLINTYGKEVMICEVGMSWDAANAANFMSKIVSESKQIDGCLGVFYWEPECYGGWNVYTKGAFDSTGKPTSALNAYKD